MSETFLPSAPFLPDDVVIDILSRLPSKDVLRFRCVCKGWNYLSSTRDFTDSLHRRSFPMILKHTVLEVFCPTSITEGFPKYNAPNLLDGCWEPASAPIIYKVYQPHQHGTGYIYLSHNGFIVTQGCLGVDFVMYNPVYTHTVNISLQPYRGDLCGVFFHPVQQQLCILFKIYQSSYGPKTFGYKIVNLESTPKWRDIRDPCAQNTRMSRIPPVLIDKFLYWMVEPFYSGTLNPACIVKAHCDILEYDIEKEEFREIPCPTVTAIDHNRYDVDLVDTDGVLSVVQLLQSQQLVKINIWTLKDDGEQLWTSCNYVFSFDVNSRSGRMPKAIAFRDGELLLLSNGRLRVCNLKLGTFRMVGQEYGFHDFFLSHVMSLHSLKNFQSNICYVEEDERIRRERGHCEEIQPHRDN